MPDKKAPEERASTYDSKYRSAEEASLQVQTPDGAEWSEKMKVRLKRGSMGQVMIRMEVLRKMARKGGVEEKVALKREWTCRQAYQEGLIGPEIKLDDVLYPWDPQQKVHGGQGGGFVAV